MKLINDFQGPCIDLKCVIVVQSFDPFNLACWYSQDTKSTLSAFSAAIAMLVFAD